MKINCGTDIVEIKRIEDIINQNGDRFFKRVYTENEIQYCEASQKHKIERYAARYAAKEAIFKAISNLLENKFEIGWQNIEIINQSNGKPIVNFINFTFNEEFQIDISLSHEKKYVVAFAIIYC